MGTETRSGAGSNAAVESHGLDDARARCASGLRRLPARFIAAGKLGR